MKMRRPLGEILLEQELITKEQLSVAAKEQKETGEDLATILISRGQVSRKVIGNILEVQTGIPYVNLEEYEVQQSATMVVSEEFIRRHSILPIKQEDGLLYVAMTDPSNLETLDEIKLITKMQIIPLLTTKVEIQEAISKHLMKERVDRVVEDLKTDDITNVSVSEMEGMGAEDAPVIRLVDTIINNGIFSRASDIHLEPQEKNVRVRYRIDGLLNDVLSFPRAIHAAVISRIKIISEMNIAESHRPQDGHLVFKTANRAVDLRISCIEGVEGEKIVMRILDKNTALLGLKDLGMASRDLAVFQNLLRKPYGIVLVTGPTGCGKTTTLYAALQELNVSTKNIVTIEDPVEYRISNITQIQVNPKSGLTFATGLRTIVRQDPDIILVGEIRDQETAKIAVEAALTGHLIFSTLHTNDAASAITRLSEMGIEPFLIASSVIGVVAQRLMRIVCPECRQTYKPESELLSKINLQGMIQSDPEFVLSKGSGCKSCSTTGYRGRKGIFELMELSPKIKKLVLENAPSDAIKEQAISDGMHTMQEDGIRKIVDGTSTPEELLRIIYTD